jgi:arsenate reductase
MVVAVWGGADRYTAKEMVRVFGIANCDTVKQARAWLDGHGVAYEWVDFKRAPPALPLLERWSERVGWEALLNRRGTTWRKLAPEAQARVTSARPALELMIANPSVIRRPVVEQGGDLFVGFDAADWSRRFAKR